jgi:hypothetical protein
LVFKPATAYQLLSPRAQHRAALKPLKQPAFDTGSTHWSEIIADSAHAAAGQCIIMKQPLTAT